ncbi:MAG: peptidylprolyl isomerase, partial [Gammaproteobacteria bacterium]|nr:peptidylprolyl isomerase [Gammaproteobacteria bacterium]
QWDRPPEFSLADSVNYSAEIELENGAIVVIDLYEELAPEHVNNFVFLAQEGFYDDLTFHRVVPGFVAQAGDPTATGTGSAGYTLHDEPLHAGNEDALSVTPIGVVSMARSGLGASSSQFFIKLGDQAHLDEQGFTAFGVVTSGLDLLYAFDSRDPANVPPPPAGARIVEIRIIEQ